MAEAVGISPSSVGRIWAEAGLKPHLTRAFKGLCCKIEETFGLGDQDACSLRLSRAQVCGPNPARRATVFDYACMDAPWSASGS